MQFDSLSLLRGELRPGAVRSPACRCGSNGRWRGAGDCSARRVLRSGTVSPRPATRRRTCHSWRTCPPGKLRLEDVRVEYEDLRRGLGPWEFLVDALDLQLGDGRLALSASGTLPVALGSNLAVSLAVTSQNEHGRPRDWVAGASFSRLDLRAIGDALGRTRGLPATGSSMAVFPPRRTPAG
jgi:hypothetical protein